MTHDPATKRRAERLASLVHRTNRMIDQESLTRPRRVLSALSGRSDECRFDVNLSIVEASIAARDFDSVRAVLGYSHQLASTREEVLWVSLIEGHLEALVGNARKAIRLVHAVARSKNVPPIAIARARMIMGIAFYRTGHYSWAKSSFEEAESYYRLTRARGNLLRTLISKALVLKSLGNIHGALYQLDESAKLLPRSRFSGSRRRIHLNRGVCLLKLGRVSEARASFMGAQGGDSSEDCDQFLAISVYNNLGHVYRIEGRFDIALEFHGKALELARGIGSRRQECLSLEFLGETQGEAGSLTEALRSLNEANAIAMEIAGQGDVRMEVLRRRGEILARLGSKVAAAEDLERCIHLCRSRGERREAVLAERALVFVEAPPHEFAMRVQRVLGELRELSDRFEFVRTVVQVLEDRRLDLDTAPWLAAAHAAAVHYGQEMGIECWSDRLTCFAPFHSRGTTVESNLRATSIAVPTRSWRYERALEAARVASRSRLPVLVVGETGAGKEVVSEFVHRSSARSSAPLLAVNCGALPDALLESELFGHARGAFTGADREKLGLLAAAHGGSILLDEIADLPALAQVKLLRFMDTGEVRRVGEIQPRYFDVRVIACTNRNLEDLVAGGRFREDLMFRLRAFVIEVPALRDRREDILELAIGFLRESAQSSLPIRLSAALQSWMLEYRWPGNVRELRNLCGYLSARAWGKSEIDLVDLPPQHGVRTDGSNAGRFDGTFDRERDDLERSQIERALRTTEGRIAEAARLLGMGRNTLARRMRAHGMASESTVHRPA